LLKNGLKWLKTIQLRLWCGFNFLTPIKIKIKKKMKQNNNKSHSSTKFWRKESAGFNHKSKTPFIFEYSYTPFFPALSFF